MKRLDSMKTGIAGELGVGLPGGRREPIHGGSDAAVRAAYASLEALPPALHQYLSTSQDIALSNNSQFRSEAFAPSMSVLVQWFGLFWRITWWCYRVVTRIGEATTGAFAARTAATEPAGMLLRRPPCGFPNPRHYPVGEDSLLTCYLFAPGTPCYE